MATICFNETYKYFSDHPISKLPVTCDSDVMGEYNTTSNRSKRHIEDSDEPAIAVSFEKNEQAVKKRIKKLKQRNNNN